VEGREGKGFEGLVVTEVTKEMKKKGERRGEGGEDASERVERERKGDLWD